jgi:hypothetical protein
MKKTLLFFAALISGATMIAQVRTIDSGLVACYPFTGNANDMSGNGHNGTVVGATLCPDRWGHANSAYLFANSPTTYISVPNFNTILTSNNISVSFWAQATANTSDQPFLAQPDSQADRFGIAVQYESNGEIWDYGNLVSPNGRMNYSGSSYSSAWIHYVFLISQSQNIKKIFMNGVMVDSNSYTNAGMSYSPAGKTLNIGGGYGSNGPWAGFPGPIDDIRIYNRALSDAEVLYLYNEPITGYGCSTLGLPDMDQGSAPYIYSSAPGVIHMDFGQSPFTGTLAVYNMLGQKIAEKQMNTPRFGTEVYTLQSGAKGMYLLVLTSGNNHYTYKFEL